MPFPAFNCVKTAALAVALLFSLPAAAGAPPDTFADLAERLAGAVVNVSTTQVVEPRADGQPTAPGGENWEEWFRDYFERRQQGEPEGQTQPRKRRQTSMGSGFIIDTQGYIVTNNHVVENADQISVTLHDDTVVEAKIVGSDPKTDVALLKIETDQKLIALKWGNSDASRVGDWVVAIGNPFGLGGTVTAGIISARAREIEAGPYDDFIQTDASINRGNSGGPLFNMAGEVIGVNTAIFSPSGGSVGIGFAASSNLVRPVLESLLKYGRTRRGWLGVQIQSVTEEIASSLGLERARGALVSEVNEGSPAALAGIEPSDIILTFDGKAIDRMRELPRVVAETTLDKVVDVSVWRQGKARTFKVKVAELQEGEAQAASLPAVPEQRQVPRTELADLDIFVSEITDRSRERYEIPAQVSGLVVVAVGEDSDAAEKGLRQGDVIEEIQQMAVTSPDDAIKALAKAKADKRTAALLRVQRGEQIIYVAIKIEEKG